MPGALSGGGARPVSYTHLDVYKRQGVGTPEQPDGSADLTYIATVARQIAETIEKDCLVVVKSTVPVGTNDKVEQFIHDFLPRHGDSYTGNGAGFGKKIRVEVASNPEFLAQGSAVDDMLHADRIVIGTKSKWAEERLMKIYAPFNIPLVSVSRRSAEMITVSYTHLTYGFFLFKALCLIS